MTNNGWFWHSSNIPQHLANARFRCIELRRPMARAANTGISCFINPYGGFTDPDDSGNFERIIRDDDTGSPHITGVLPATLRLDNDPPVTLYARYGDAFSITLGLIALGPPSFSSFAVEDRRTGLHPVPVALARHESNVPRTPR